MRCTRCVLSNSDLQYLSVLRCLKIAGVRKEIEERQKKQVEGHLRVALKIESGFRTMETVCPSGPILAEGACSVMA